MLDEVSINPVNGVRTRIRQDNEIRHITWNWNNSEGAGDWWAFSYARIFTDLVHQKRTKFYSVHPCTDIEYDLTGVGRTSNWSGSMGLTVNVHDSPLLQSDTTAIISIIPSIPAGTIERLNLEALNYFGDIFPMTESFAEFIVGLNQLQDLVPKLQESISKTISGGYLNKSFGWDNLVADLNALHDLFHSIYERLDYLRKTYGKPQRLHFVRKNIHPVDVSLFVNEIHAIALWWGTRYKLVNYQTSYSATAWILNTLDHIDGLTGLLRGMIGALGLDNPVKAVWVNLPFSFVIDWFFKISSHLDQLTKVKPAAGWNVYNITNTVKVDADFAVYQINSGYDTDKYKGQGRYKSYVRALGLPVGLASLVPDLNTLSPNQLALITAMLHQRG